MEGLTIYTSQSNQADKLLAIFRKLNLHVQEIAMQFRSRKANYALFSHISFSYPIVAFNNIFIGDEVTIIQLVKEKLLLKKIKEVAQLLNIKVKMKFNSGTALERVTYLLKLSEHQIMPEYGQNYMQKMLICQSINRTEI